AKWPEAYLRNPGDEPAGLCSRPARRPQAGVSRRRNRRATVALPLLWPASELRGFLQQRLERLQRCHLFLVLLPLLQLLLTVLQRLRPHRIACAYSVHVSSPVGSSLPAGLPVPMRCPKAPSGSSHSPPKELEGVSRVGFDRSERTRTYCLLTLVAEDS